MREVRDRSVAFLLAAHFFGALAAVDAPAAAQQPLGPGSFRAYAAGDADSRMSDFSGLPVPRYASLRYDKVNGRAGPSPDYPVRWTYERAGVPVIIIRESQDWRKIRDPQGDEVWVRSRLLSGERTAIATHDGAIRRNPDVVSSAMARFAPGAVMTLGTCEGGWCRVEAEGVKGWAMRDQLWGDESLASPAK